MDDTGDVSHLRNNPVRDVPNDHVPKVSAGIRAVNRQDVEEAFAPALCALIPAESLGTAAPGAPAPLIPQFLLVNLLLSVETKFPILCILFHLT